MLTFNTSPTTWLQATRTHVLLTSLTFPALLLKTLTFTMTGCFGIFPLLRTLYLVAQLHRIDNGNSSSFPWQCLYPCLFTGQSPQFIKVDIWAEVLIPLFIFYFLTAQYVGSQFPNQGSNPYSLHWMLRVPTTGSPSTSRKFCSSSSLSGNASYQLAQSILGDICWSWACGDECLQHCPSLLGTSGVCWCSRVYGSCGPCVSKPSLVWWL